jgi:hypothetical protein
MKENYEIKYFLFLEKKEEFFMDSSIMVFFQRARKALDKILISLNK